MLLFNYSFKESFDLHFVGIDALLKGKFTERLHKIAGGGDIAENQCPALNGVPGNLHQACIEFPA